AKLACKPAYLSERTFTSKYYMFKEDDEEFYVKQNTTLSHFFKCFVEFYFILLHILLKIYDMFLLVHLVILQYVLLLFHFHNGLVLVYLQFYNDPLNHILASSFSSHLHLTRLQLALESV